MVVGAMESSMLMRAPGEKTSPDSTTKSERLQGLLGHAKRKWGMRLCKFRYWFRVPATKSGSGLRYSADILSPKLTNAIKFDATGIGLSLNQLNK